MTNRRRQPTASGAVPEAVARGTNRLQAPASGTAPRLRDTASAAEVCRPPHGVNPEAPTRPGTGAGAAQAPASAPPSAAAGASPAPGASEPPTRVPAAATGSPAPTGSDLATGSQAPGGPGSEAPGGTASAAGSQAPVDPASPTGPSRIPGGPATPHTPEPHAAPGTPEPPTRVPTAATDSPAPTGSGAPGGAGSPAGSLPSGPGSPTGSPTGPATATGSAAAAISVHRPQPLGQEDRRRLLDGSHHDPHGVLGAHPYPGGGVLFRTLRPGAVGVSVLAEGTRAELQPEGDSFYAGVLPLAAVPPAYRLLVSGADGVREVEDPYRFLPALGELDVHLIHEGRHEQLWKALGSEPMTHAGVTGTRFAVWAPNAQGVRVVGDFNRWDGTAFPMRSLGGSGVWELFVPGVGEGERYKFEIATRHGGRVMKADPMARRTEVPPATASVVTRSRHEWQDGEWLARRADVPVTEAPMSVYEVHLASWRPGLTYRELAEQLPAYLTDLGFTHVELMPVAEHPFGGSWGYQVTSYYAPTSRLGSPDDFRYLVDALHRAGIGVIVDWVPAHFPKDDWALARFDGEPLYEPADPRRAEHPDWGTYEFDFGRTEVRNFLVANAVYWCEEFHVDGLRVDAVASMLYLDYSRGPGQWTPNVHGGRENLDAVAFLQEMNATVYRRCPGVVTVAEESTAWDGVTRATHHVGPAGFGGLGFGLKWNMGWMHDSLGYLAHEPVHRRYHHHEMTFSMVYAYSENYVLPISHDEVVHGKRSLVSKMPGDWWQQRANERAYLGFMWSHPGKQLLFMGQEFAQGAEWSHDHGPDWWLLDESHGASADHRGVQNLVRDLNAVYRGTPALWQRDTSPEGFEWIVGDAAEDNVFAFVRYDAARSPLIAVSNFSPVVRHAYRIGAPDGPDAWREVLNTDGARYGGGDVRNEEPLKTEPTGWHGRAQSIQLTLPPLATVWLRPAT